MGRKEGRGNGKEGEGGREEGKEGGEHTVIPYLLRKRAVGWIVGSRHDIHRHRRSKLREGRCENGNVWEVNE